MFMGRLWHSKTAGTKIVDNSSMKYHAAPASDAAAAPADPAALAARLADLLPQTQCTKCGYAGCQPYAEAVAAGTAGYNQCPPGGQEGVARLAALLGRPVIPLNPEHGVERARPVARIDETLCIGCTLCLQACPVDAIVGAAKQMHTVIEALCTGCDLCVAPCPVDCISMIPVTGEQMGWNAWTQDQADAARRRHARHEARAASARAAAEARLRERDAARRAQAANPQAPVEDEAARKRAVIQAALERARQKKAELAAAGLGPKNTDDVSPAVQAQIDAAERRRRRLGLAGEDNAAVPDVSNQDHDA
jgi:Na+-translocating ferredoxin:NAD+ oxidoreductase subunit B